MDVCCVIGIIDDDDDDGVVSNQNVHVNLHSGCYAYTHNSWCHSDTDTLPSDIVRTQIQRRSKLVGNYCYANSKALVAYRTSRIAVNTVCSKKVTPK